MKSYKYFIKESEEQNSVIKDEVEYVYSMLNEKCTPFLNEIKKCEPELFWRGTDFNYDIFLIKHNWYRRPKDTPYELHDMFNNLFYRKFKWEARNGIFATKNRREAENYGQPHLIFPIGDFGYVWSPRIVDFFSSTEDNMMIQTYGDYDVYLNMNMWNPDELTIDEFEKEYDKEIEHIMKGYIDYDLCKIKNQEISFNCDEYFLVSRKYHEELTKLIWKD